MASMNNWLGFSLSGQETQSPQPLSAEEEAAFSSNTTIRPAHDGSFSILEAFNRSPHDWSMKSSELSMLVESSTNCNNMEEDEPKLEDFLGGSFEQKIDSMAADHYNMYSSSCSNQIPEVASGGGNSSIGLSMIKTWLRNQPAPGQLMQYKGGGGGDGFVMSGGENDSILVGSVGGGSSHGLSLSMSTGSQPGSALQLVAAGMRGSGGESSSASENKEKGGESSGIDAIEAVPRKSVDTFGQRTSIYRGVTRHRWTGRYEAHLWDNSCRREGQTRKGRQVYLGGYDKEEKAARAYDLAALKYWGTTTTTNFPISNYEKEVEEMKHMTRQEYVASLRRKSSGFSRGASIYRGVTRHHQHGRWQARIGRVAGNKDLYLGTFSTQEEAAEAYDIAAIKFRGLNAVTNFDMSRYDVKSILESSTLPIGGGAKRLKDVADHSESSIDGQRSEDSSTSIVASHLRDAALTGYASSQHHGWPTIAFQQPQHLGVHYPYATTSQQRGWCKPEPDAAGGHGLQEMQQLHQASGTHNFFQTSPMHNMVGLDSLVEHGGGPSSVMYGSGSGYVMPMGSMVVDSGQAAGGGGYRDNEVKSSLGYDHSLLAAGSDPYGGRNAYYPTGVVKESGYDQHGNAGWMLNQGQAVPPRSGGSMSNCHCHGAPLFTVWNDA